MYIANHKIEVQGTKQLFLFTRQLANVFFKILANLGKLLATNHHL